MKREDRNDKAKGGKEMYKDSVGKGRGEDRTQGVEVEERRERDENEWGESERKERVRREVKGKNERRERAKGGNGRVRREGDG